MRVKRVVIPFLAIVVGMPLWSLPTVSAESSDSPLCLYVSSYHSGYAWSDGIETALRDALHGKCDIVEFYMDTKRQKTPQQKQAAGMAAYQMIIDRQPDVVITSDDNAAKYLIVPHLVESAVPVVFSGINWTVEEYGFPAVNVTGIVEVAPIRPMLLEGLKANNQQSGQGLSVAYLGAMTLTEVKNFERVYDTANTLGMRADSILTENFEAWKYAFTLAQEYDMVVMGSSSGISGFDNSEAIEWVDTHTRKLSTTNHEWMMPYSAIGYTKIAEEQGEWAAASTLAILNGIRAEDIPLVTNRRWDTWINTRLLAHTNVSLDDTIVKHAKKVQ